ncbi:MAG: collagen-like protein [Lachnospiraceae bacterium]|nr:collagen-like protein [Lachnospiraceae bacterium]
MENWKDRLGQLRLSKKTVIIMGLTLAALLAFLLASAYLKGNAGEKRKEAAIAYDYTAEELALARQVREYLAEHVELNEAESGRIGDAAVKSFRTILASGVESVTEGHTQALAQRMRHALEAEIAPETATEEDLEALSHGICTLIWEAVLGALEVEGAGESSRAQLTEASMDASIRQQLEWLEDKKITLRISSGSLKGNAVTKEELENSQKGLLLTLGENITEGISGLRSELLKEIETRIGGIQAGKDGKDGRDGATGAQGPRGEKGDTGATGAAGATGAQGPKGEKGDTGATGAQGEKGDTGAAGAQGEKGEKGDTGAAGAQGEKGEKGDTGATGAQGENGEKGDTGATGAQGEKGDTGAAGAQGEKGEKGDTGATGAQGEKGEKGDTGATGAQGEKGEKGDTGADGLGTYYRYSAYANGKVGGTAAGAVSMSAAPSNLTKYIGVAHSAEGTAPASPDAYVWSEYKDYILYSEEDSTGTPTLYIR